MGSGCLSSVCPRYYITFCFQTLDQTEYNFSPPRLITLQSTKNKVVSGRCNRANAITASGAFFRAFFGQVSGSPARPPPLLTLHLWGDLSRESSFSPTLSSGGGGELQQRAACTSIYFHNLQNSPLFALLSPVVAVLWLVCGPTKWASPTKLAPTCALNSDGAPSSAKSLLAHL